MEKRTAVATVTSLAFLALIHTTVGLKAQTKPAAPRATGSTGTLVVDTDDTCRLRIDGQDQGVVKPDEGKKISMKVGEHILKCTVEGVPDVVWRKVIEVKSSEQVAALVSLRAQHEAATPKEREAEKSNSIAPDGTADERQNASSHPEAASSTAKDTTAENVCPPQSQTMPPIKFKDLERIANAKDIVSSMPFDVRVDFVRCAGGFVLVPVTVQIKNRDITFMNRNGTEQATVNLFGRVSTAAGEVVQVFGDPLQVSVPADTLPTFNEKSSVYWEALSLRPGRFKIEVVTKDIYGDRIGIYRQEIAVPEFSGDKLATSSLILADQIGPAQANEAGAGPFVIGQTKIRPRAAADGKSATFKHDQKVGFWMQVYNLGMDDKTHKTSATVQYKLTDLATSKLVTNATESIENTGAQLTVQKMLSTAKLQPGTYRMKIKVTDNVSKQAVDRSAVFAIERPTTPTEPSPSSEQVSDGSVASAQSPNPQRSTRPVAGASAQDRAIGDQDESLLWLRVLASLAKGTPSQELINEIKGRSIAFLFNNPNDEINQEYVRSLGGTDRLIEAAREARNGDDDNISDAAAKRQFAAAEADVRKALAANPNKAVLHQLLGIILFMNQPKDAVAELHQAIALDPKSASSHLYLGWALIGADAEDEAPTEFRESLRLMPHQITSHLMLYSLLKQKDKDGALAELKQALQVDPGAYPVHQDLGDYYSEQKEYDLAIAEYQTAIRLKASSFPAHSGLARAFFAKNDYAKAVPEFQEYLRLDKRPGSENAHSFLAICFYQLGRFEKAAAEERIVLAAHPDDQNAKGWLAAANSKMNSAASGGGARGGNTQPAQEAPNNVVHQGTLIKKVQPVYPPEARNARVQGTVRLHAVIGVDGAVKELTVISGPPQLTAAALDAVRQWRYQPYIQNGRAAEVDTKIDVKFVLEVVSPGGSQQQGMAAEENGPPAAEYPNTVGPLQLRDQCLTRDPRPWNPHTAGIVAALYLRNTCGQAVTVSFCFKEPDQSCWKCDTIAPGPGQSDTPASLRAGCRTSNCSELQITYHAVYSSDGLPPKPNVDDSCVAAVH